MTSEQSIRIIESPREVFTVLKEHRLTEAPIFILADASTSEHCLPLIQNELPGAGRRAILLNVSDGEGSKSIETVNQLYDRLIEYRADRHSVLINIGGGMICDLGGFVASTFKRGMKCINIPTTVLAQVDASVGGKTGINHRGYKNMIGTFQLPMETLIFPEFLNTLPKREVMSGFAEMVKHAIIGDEQLWTEMKEAPFIDLPFIKKRIVQALDVKKNIVLRDFKEQGERKKLNFGHTIGHALESHMMESPDRNILHGEAIALGMISETFISNKKGYITEGLMNDICEFIAKNFNGIELHQSQYHRLIEIMRQDKKGNRNNLNMTLIKGIGEAVIDRNPPMEMIIDSLTFLQRYPFKA